jgi:hypothetical protein
MRATGAQSLGDGRRGRSCRACLTLIRIVDYRSRSLMLEILRTYLVLLAEFGGKGER